jgi:hypothetical protein
MQPSERENSALRKDAKLVEIATAKHLHGNLYETHASGNFLILHYQNNIVIVQTADMAATLTLFNTGSVNFVL